MRAQGSGLCALVLLAWLAGTVYPWALASWDPGLAPMTPRNSSGVPGASLPWLSVRVPFLLTLWTLVALSALLGKRLRRVGSPLVQSVWLVLVLVHDSSCPVVHVSALFWNNRRTPRSLSTLPA